MFAEPHRLDVIRETRRHIAFGWPPWKGGIAFRALFDHFARIELNGTRVRQPTFTLRGLESPPVAQTAAY